MKKTIITVLVLLMGTLLPAQAQTEYLLIEDCIELARSNEANARNAELDVRSAIEQRKEARWEFGPKINATGVGFVAANPMIYYGLRDILGTGDNAMNIINAVEEYCLESGIDPYFKGLENGIGLGITALQPVFAGGRIVNGNKLADLGVSAALLQKEVKLQSSEADVEEKYWQVVSLQEKKKTLEESLPIVERLCADARNAAESGLITTADFLELEQTLRDLKAKQSKLKGGLRLAKMDLFNLVGYEYRILQLDSIELASSPLLDYSPDYYYMEPEEMAQGMAESRLLEMQVEAKILQKKITLGESLPQLAVGAGASYSNYVNEFKPNAMAFVMLQIPISDWGKQAHKLRRAENDVQKARNDKEYLDKQLILKAQALWVQMSSAWDELEVLMENSREAQETYERLSLEHGAGLSDTPTLLQAQINARQAKDAAIDAQIAYRSAVDAYLRVCRD
ncbi:MAG: TolC family protein [Candidatus Cryptobacteroides sp.]